jgi:hypothetical protein
MRFVCADELLIPHRFEAKNRRDDRSAVFVNDTSLPLWGAHVWSVRRRRPLPEGHRSHAFTFALHAVLRSRKKRRKRL